FAPRSPSQIDGCCVRGRPWEMAVQAIFRNVQFPAYEPFRERRLPLDNLVPRLTPGHVLRFSCPTLGRLVDRFSIHSAVLSQTLDPRLTAEAGCWLKNAFFDQMRFDIVVHGQSLICARSFQGKCASSVVTGACGQCT